MKNIDVEDIEIGLNHLSTLASEIHDELQVKQMPDMAIKLERMAFWLWMMQEIVYAVHNAQCD
jgi:hypothetical protein